ncbi:MAG: hypothetical protein EPN33_01150 [Acidobacteria bacterium]|nr:MAG: hypothetical protein EPN33_01150 [Acidobacteriota bacterium]
MSEPAAFTWTFHTPFPEQTEAFVALASGIAQAQQVRLLGARRGDGLVLHVAFAGDGDEAEERGRAYWAELHSRSLDENLAMELVEGFEPEEGWRALEAFALDGAEPLARRQAPAAALAPQRPPLAPEPLYDILRGDDPEMDRNLEQTIAWIEGNGLPVINLLSYLELPLFTDYAAAHEDERDQNLFLHMLHTWTCYRRFEAVHARVPEALAQAFEDPRYLRINTTQFRSPAPALCVQFVDWTQPVRGVGGGRMQWAKEVYLTHFEPPTPAEERELTLMFITYDERGEFGFIPLEVPLSLPAVEESIEAFFAPSEGDEELGANTEDLKRLTQIAATYCLYATARDPGRYLQS